MSRGAVIIPADLTRRILKAGLSHGWLDGTKSKTEEIFVVWSAAIGEEEVVSEALPRVSTHRACQFQTGIYKPQLLEWWVVAPGVSRRFSSRLSLTADEFGRLLPTEATEEERFLVAVEAGPNGPELAAFSVSRKDDTVKSLPLDTILLPPEKQPFARVASQLVASLSAMSVVIVGLGSGGSEIALNLACAGIGKLTLVDYDRLQPENYVRFIVGCTELGRRKIDIVRTAIRERDLPTRVAVYPFDVVSDADWFRGLLDEGTDLVICATDSVESRRTINAAAVLLNRSLVIAGILEDGRIGEVLRVVPYQLPCYECVRMQLGTVLAVPESEERAPTPYVGSEEAPLHGTALRSDIALVASLATRVALHELAPEHFPELPASYVVWGREADDSRPDPFRFSSAFSTNYVRLGRRKDCPLCGAPPAELMGIDAQKAADEILANAVEL
jgi:molybdopterin/thiamine biosynthesis adenylyltransferase